MDKELVIEKLEEITGETFSLVSNDELLSEISADLKGYARDEQGRIVGLRMDSCLDIKAIELLVELVANGLEALGLNDNGKFRDFSFLQNFGSLTWLDLRGNELTDVSFLKELKGLTWLDLRSNKLTDVSFLKELKGLTWLDLRGNELTDVSFLKELEGLTWLNLSGNEFTDVSFLKELKGLTWLNLSGNELTDVSFLKELKGLTSLGLGGNELTDVSFLKELEGLTWLNLSGNELTDVSFLKELEGLTWLNLRSNKLTDVSFLKELKGLTSLNLHANPNLKEPPEKIIGEGPEAIRNYFHQIEKQGTDQIYEAKVLFVGEPEAGKTSLMKKLQDPSYLVPNPKPEQSTLGIDIVPDWTFPFTYDPTIKFKAHLWDFGGQDIQYYIHQFFLTERSLYILVVDDRKDYPNIDYWFNIIRLLGKGSPILLVRNEKNIDAAVGFDRAKYESRYKDIYMEFYDVNLAKGGHQLEVIDEKIKEKLCKLEHVGDSVPANWIHVKADLTTRKSANHISLSEFNEICAAHEIPDDQDQITLLGYLHALGILLNYRSESGLRDIVFLNPRWITDAVYSMLSDKEIEKQKGRFSKAWLFDRWGDGYSDEEKDKLLLLMQKREFDLCYRLEDQGEESYLLPQLLQDVAPIEANEWDRKGSLCFRYRYGFMPIGIMTRIIVRLSEWITNDLTWRSGVILTKDGCEALVKDDIKDGLRVIDISVRGDEFTRRDFLSLIRGTIDGIHKQSFESANVEPLVPCNCEVCDGSEDPMFFGRGRLHGYLKAGEEAIKCEKGKQFRNVPIVPMLEGFLSRGEREKISLGGGEDRDPAILIVNLPAQTLPSPAEKHTESPAKENKSVLFERYPLLQDWWIRSILAGLAVGVLTAIAIPDPWNWRLSVAAGTVVTALMLINNPRKRYMKAFWSVLGVLSLWNVLPGLRASFSQVGASGKTSFELLIESLDWPVNLGLILLLCYLLYLDYQEGR